MKNDPKIIDLVAPPKAVDPLEGIFVLRPFFVGPTEFIGPQLDPALAAVRALQGGLTGYLKDYLPPVRDLLMSEKTYKIAGRKDYRAPDFRFGEIQDATRWMRSMSSVNVGSGRTTLLAMVYIEKALIFPEFKIRFVDHYKDARRSLSVIYSTIADLLGKESMIAAKRRISLGSSEYIIASQLGMDEINCKGTLEATFW